MIGDDPPARVAKDVADKEELHVRLAWPPGPGREGL